MNDKPTDDGINVQLRKSDFVSCLAREIYRIPFPNEVGDVSYPCKTVRFGPMGLKIEMDDGSEFIISVK